MTRHLLRLVWNRKRQNALLSVEIFFSFLVLFSVTLFAVHLVNNWSRPLGFNAERIWSIGASPSEREPGAQARNRASIARIVAALRDLPAVEAAAAASTFPYSGSDWGSGVTLDDGRKLQYSVAIATDEFADLMGLRITAGRWFAREDEASDVEPVVINQRLATAVFGDTNPIGRLIPETHTPLEDGFVQPYKRVVGVVDEYRKNGEFETPPNALFYRVREHVPDGVFVVAANSLAIKVRAGTTAEFEETLLARLRPLAPGWSFQVVSLDAMRERRFRSSGTIMLLATTIAGFLLLMVALGLTGVVWQSVTERTREFGLRRAKGARIPNIHRQVLAELGLMTSIAIAAGVLLVLQLPALPLPPDTWPFPAHVFAASVALSVVVIYLLTLLCGWYPSRMATRVQPAEALHYE